MKKMKVYFLRVVAIILLNNKIVEGEDGCVRKLNRLGPMLRNSFSYHSNMRTLDLNFYLLMSDKKRAIFRKVVQVLFCPFLTTAN